LKPLYADLARILKENIDGIQSRYIRYGNPLDAVSSGSKFQKTIFQYTVAREFFLRKKNYYKYKSLSSRADLSVNYIYYPLASQPECSTIPAGNEFSFQLIAANALAFALPPGWKR
jgi:hypothetical protein